MRWTTHRAGHRRQIRGGKGRVSGLPLNSTVHRKTQAQGLDAIAQVGQVNAVQLDPGTGNGFGDGSTSMDALASAAAVSISTR